MGYVRQWKGGISIYSLKAIGICGRRNDIPAFPPTPRAVHHYGVAVVCTLLPQATYRLNKRGRGGIADRFGNANLTSAPRDGQPQRLPTQLSRR